MEVSFSFRNVGDAALRAGCPARVVPVYGVREEWFAGRVADRLLAKKRKPVESGSTKTRLWEKVESMIDYEFDVWCNDVHVAGASMTEREALKRSPNYVTQYSEDGPCEIWGGHPQKGMAGMSKFTLKTELGEDLHLHM